MPPDAAGAGAAAGPTHWGPDSAARDAERARRLAALHLVEIPRIRIAGCALLALAVLLHNRLVFGSAGAWLPFAGALMSYALAAALLLRVLHGRLTRFDPSIIFLAADLPFWAAAVYVTGADRSWLFFVMVLRTADQTVVSLRRAVIFAHLAAVMYPAMLLYAVWVDGHPVSWPVEITKTLLIYAGSLYISLIARTGERYRRRRAETQRLAEELSHTAWRQEQLLLRIFNATSDGLVFISPRGHVESANAQAGQLLGFDAAAATGCEAADILGRQARTIPDGAPFDGVLRNVVAARAEAHGHVRGSAGRILHWHAQPTDDDGGGFLGLTVTVRDVTRPQELIEQLEENARLLEEARGRAETAGRARAEFLANITHELRTPLAAIIGLSQLARDARGDEQRRHLRRMQVSAESLLASINDILDYSKMDAGRLELEHVPFSLRAIVDEVLDTASLSAEDKGLSLARGVEPDVPDICVGDPVRVRQVLSNLVGNAVKFTEKGGVNVRVGVAALADGQALVHVEVADTGIGIPPEKQKWIFEAFAQADGSTTRRYGGTGLGLSIAAHLTSLMGGNLWVESEPGHGSRFHFTAALRVHESAQAGPAGEAIETTGDRRREPARGIRRILMADDSPLQRELLSHLLRARGYEVVSASNGAEAVTAFTATRIDAVIVDWQMPEMDGLQTTRAIRQAERHTARRVPIIAATAAVRPEDRTRGLAAGVDYFLAKPIPTSMLLSILETGPKEVPGPDPDAVSAGRAELLAHFGDEQLVRRMIELFLGEGPRLVGELRAALDRGDRDGVRKSAHALNGAIANFPAPDARRTAAQMERLALAGDLVQAETLFPELRDAVRWISLQLPTLL